MASFGWAHGFLTGLCWKQGDDIPWLYPSSQWPGKPVMLASTLFPSGPDPALWSLVGVLQLSLVDTEFSCCVWKHHWEKPSRSQGARGGYLLCIPGALSAHTKGLIICSSQTFLWKRFCSGHLFYLSKKKSRSRSHSDYSSWYLSILKLNTHYFILLSDEKKKGVKKENWKAVL